MNLRAFYGLFQGILPHRVTSSVIDYPLGGVFALRSDKTATHAQVSYLHIGTYGNTLIGNPNHEDAFARFFTARGGLKVIIPLSFSNQYRETAQSLFKRYGLTFAVPEKVATAWSVPRLTTELKVLEPQLRFELAQRSDMTQQLQFTIDGKRYHCCAEHGVAEGELAAVQEAKNRVSDRAGGSFLLPSWIVGTRFKKQLGAPVSTAPIPRQIEHHLQDLEKIFFDVQRSLSDDEFLCELEKRSFVYFVSQTTRTIALFDDSFYESYDFDSISPSARSQIRKLLLELGAKELDSRHYALGGMTLELARSPRTLMSGAHEVSADWMRSDKGFFFLTPTQQLSLLLSDLLNSNGNTETKIYEEIMALVHVLPCNIPRLKKQFKEVAKQYPNLRKEIVPLQKIISKHYERWRPKGAIGKPYKKDVKQES